MAQKRKFDSTERIGVNVLATIVTDFGWIFREQPVADFGIDAHIEGTEDGVPTGQLFAVQVKTGASYFRGSKEYVTIYVDDDHMRYWENHSLPVILVLHHPDECLTLWQWAEVSTATQTSKGWRIDIPRSNIFDLAAKDRLSERARSEPEFERRQRFAIDKPFMREFVCSDAYITIDVWVNKTWKIREIEIRFDDEDKKEPDYIMQVLVTWGYDVDDVMEHFFPWVQYEYAEEIEDGSGEVEGHHFYVQLTDVAKAFLTVEDYFEKGYERDDTAETHYSDLEPDCM